MSKTPEAVWKMIKELASKAKPVAKEELETLQVSLQEFDVFLFRIMLFLNTLHRGCHTLV